MFCCYICVSFVNVKCPNNNNINNNINSNNNNNLIYIAPACRRRWRHRWSARSGIAFGFCLAGAVCMFVRFYPHLAALLKEILRGLLKCTGSSEIFADNVGFCFTACMHMSLSQLRWHRLCSTCVFVVSGDWEWLFFISDTLVVLFTYLFVLFYVSFICCCEQIMLFV